MAIIFKVIMSDKAMRDLRELNDYIAEQFRAPETAENQTRRIIRAVQSLENFPMRYRLYDPENHPNVRFFPVDNYLIFYRVDENFKTVNIDRILYNGRDAGLYL